MSFDQTNLQLPKPQKVLLEEITKLGKPVLYPVGHRLNYTQLKLGIIQVKQVQIKAEETLEISLEIKNFGKKVVTQIIPIFVAKQCEWFGNEPQAVKSFLKRFTAARRKLNCEI